MDIITAAEPPKAMAQVGSPAELPSAEPSPIDNPIEPLELTEVLPARTKLRLYAILSALYVQQP